MKAAWIGLTGNIGSGKSTVSARWAAHGARVLDADVISRGLLETDGGCYDAVTRAFPDVVLPDGAIDRRMLGGLVFRDEEARARLNAIVHPVVCAQMLAAGEATRRAEPERIVVFDAPLLFECGLDAHMDRNVLVYTSDEIRLQRIVKRDGRGVEDARQRMDAQRSQEEKRALADIVIENDGDFAHLYRQADAVYAALLEEK